MFQWENLLRFFFNCLLSELKGMNVNLKYFGILSSTQWPFPFDMLIMPNGTSSSCQCMPFELSSSQDGEWITVDFKIWNGSASGRSSRQFPNRVDIDRNRLHIRAKTRPIEIRWLPRSQFIMVLSGFVQGSVAFLSLQTRTAHRCFCTDTAISKLEDKEA